MALRISAEKLSADGLALELPIGGGRCRLVLGPSGGLTGTYEHQPDAVGLRGLHCDCLQVQSLECAVPAGTLRLQKPCRLDAAAVDGQLAVGTSRFTGRASIATTALEGLRAEFADWTIEAKVDVGPVRVDFPEDGPLQVGADGAELFDVVVDGRGIHLEVEHVALQGLELRGKPTAARFASARLEGIRGEYEGLSVQLDELTLGSVAHADGSTEIGELVLGRLKVDLAELPAFSPAAPKPSGGSRLDLPFLDDLHGTIELDVTVDLRLPILKSRRATHRVRLAVEKGTINFKQLEKSLATLEDTVLDFEVEGDALILERDLVPGMKFDNRTLVSWPLRGEDLALAKREQRVRLRKLLEYRVDPSLTSNRSSSTSEPTPLRQLEVAIGNVSLSLGGSSELATGNVRVRFGDGSGPALRKLQLSGTLQLVAEGKPPPSEVGLELFDALLGVEFSSGERRHEIEELRVDRIERARVHLQGLKPKALEVFGGKLSAQGLRSSALEPPR